MLCVRRCVQKVHFKNATPGRRALLCVGCWIDCDCDLDIALIENTKFNHVLIEDLINIMNFTLFRYKMNHCLRSMVEHNINMMRDI